MTGCCTSLYSAVSCCRLLLETTPLSLILLSDNNGRRDIFLLKMVVGEILGNFLNHTVSHTVDKVVVYSVTGSVAIALMIMVILLLSIAISMCVISCRLRGLNKKATHLAAAYSSSAAARYC